MHPLKNCEYNTECRVSFMIMIWCNHSPFLWELGQELSLVVVHIWMTIKNLVVCGRRSGNDCNLLCFSEEP